MLQTVTHNRGEQASCFLKKKAAEEADLGQAHAEFCTRLRARCELSATSSLTYIAHSEFDDHRSPLIREGGGGAPRIFSAGRAIDGSLGDLSGIEEAAAFGLGEGRP